MPIYDVPCEKWRAFCATFARDHEGVPVNLEIINAPRGIFGVIDERIQYPQAFLYDIFLNDDDASQPSLTVAVLGDRKRREHYQIRAVRHIRLEQSEPLASAGGQLLVEGENGTSLRLLLSEPVIRGMLDGV